MKNSLRDLEKLLEVINKDSLNIIINYSEELNIDKKVDCTLYIVLLRNKERFTLLKITTTEDWGIDTSSIKEKLYETAYPRFIEFFYKYAKDNILKDFDANKYKIVE